MCKRPFERTEDCDESGNYCGASKTMNVLCPFCQKMQSVPDSQAGQTTACANCHQTFSVPSLPQPLREPGLAAPNAASSAPVSSVKSAPMVDAGAEIFNISMEPTPAESRAKASPPPQ